MSLFTSVFSMGGGGDFEDSMFSDMNQQLNAMAGNPFNLIPPIMVPPSFGFMEQTPMLNLYRNHQFPTLLGGVEPRRMLGMGNMGMVPFAPFNFPNPMRLFEAGVNRSMPFSSSASPSHVYYSSNVVTMTDGPDGGREVYQSSSSVHSGPGGVQETRKSVSDTRSGIKKMQIGRRIGEKSHIVEREHNYKSGASEERLELINIDEEETEEFESDWTQIVSSGQRRGLPSNALPALPAPSQSTHLKRSSDHNSSSDSANPRKRCREADANSVNTLWNNSNYDISGNPIPLIEEPDSSSDEETEHVEEESLVTCEEETEEPPKKQKYSAIIVEVCED